ncbi:MAG: tRNA pseudouridine(38-40) synthase TruA [Parachlamydiaceae bacterium]|nr:tRNA pseudouridine(38-40) synthase TruA [Parachlamydiaceae bacterium]
MNNFEKANNIKLLIAYDGSSFDGWQRGSEGKTIEEILEKALGTICQHPIVLQAASRTDAGVHATGQVINFITDHDFSLNKLIYRLSQLLPKAIAILHAEVASENFHPTLDAIAKEYRYFVCTGRAQLPQHRIYSWHIPQTLNLQAIKEAASMLCGKFDFSSFCNKKENLCQLDTVREIFSIEIQEMCDERLCFVIKGNNFLYRMVRTIVGTLIDIGRGKISKDSIPEILRACDRKRAGICAPAHGLFLHHVFYN